MPVPIIDQKKCSLCGICVDICPVEVFLKDENNNIIVSKQKECIGCRACEAQCPKTAIVIKD
ncbi:4Fe-4S binding protein [Candidatus Woesearchaeota archaeon]|nr:4Fe-4S binding protein [Candidatus Woesearchaeota archaeon]